MRKWSGFTFFKRITRQSFSKSTHIAVAPEAKGRVVFIGEKGNTKRGYIEITIGTKYGFLRRGYGTNRGVGGEKSGISIDLL